MRRLILGDPSNRALLIEWAEQKMPFPSEFHFEPGAHAIGVAVEERLVCVAVYHDWCPQFKDIFMSIAASDPKWATPAVFGALLGFPFLGLGCQRITTWQPVDHVRARKLVEGVGFKLEGIKRMGFGYMDAAMLGLMKEEADVWLKRCPPGLYKRQEEQAPWAENHKNRR